MQRRSSALGNGVAGLKPIARARVARVAVKAMAADKVRCPQALAPNLTLPSCQAPAVLCLTTL